MFDISLGELAVIGAVALVVIGPEKLPRVARTAGMLFGRAQRLAAGFRADLERELHTAEIADLKKKLTDEAAGLQDEMAESAASITQSLSVMDNHIQPPAPSTESALLPSPESVEAAPVKPARRRRKAAELPSGEAPSSETVPVEAAEAAQLVTPPKKAPRKRKAVEPQIDLFAEAPADSAPADWGDRR